MELTKRDVELIRGSLILRAEALRAKGETEAAQARVDLAERLKAYHPGGAVLAPLEKSRGA